MAEPIPTPKSESGHSSPDSDLASGSSSNSFIDTTEATGTPLTPENDGDAGYYPTISNSSSSSSFQEDWETFPPLDKLTVFDVLSNLALPQRLEKWQYTITAQKEKVKRQREKLKSTGQNAKDRVMGEWRRRVPSSEEQLDKYRKRVKVSVDRLGTQWNATTTVTIREKVAFIAGVLNIYISGFLIGAYPEYFYLWYTGQLLFFMPIRYYRYRKRGYHYFLADLCYFVNLLAFLSFWVFPRSKRLFISTYCLTNGNNAVAIAMWRNSMVFHSLDKVTSLFIHITPPAALHCIVHLTPAAILQERFPAVYAIKYSPPDSPEHYSLGAMIIWATVPYAVWQLSYHFLITVRRSDKIAAGRPTSFTWLRKSYAKTWIGKIVLSLPDSMQGIAFMFIQYSYALLTMIPCPFWFWYRWASACFLTVVFVWSIYNGATFYIDVFGKRFQKELEQLKKDVAKWQSSADPTSPVLAPTPDTEKRQSQPALTAVLTETSQNLEDDSIPSADPRKGSTGVDGPPPDAAGSST